jgi:hypothetical protein
VTDEGTSSLAPTPEVIARRLRDLRQTAGRHEAQLGRHGEQLASIGEQLRELARLQQLASTRHADLAAAVAEDLAVKGGAVSPFGRPAPATPKSDHRLTGPVTPQLAVIQSPCLQVGAGPCHGTVHSHWPMPECHSLGDQRSLRRGHEQVEAELTGQERRGQLALYAVACRIEAWSERAQPTLAG